MPSHTVFVTVSNLYASATNSAVLTVQNTTPPVITLNGANPIYANLGSIFTDPGATANDACAGLVPVIASGPVNTSVVGTYTLIYTADDGNGNTNALTRIVIVSDPAPVIGGAATHSDGSFTLSLTGAPKNTYILETTIRLNSINGWQPIATNLIDTSGIWQFTDTQAVNFQQQFYRLMLAQ
jgi:hypothetical protein